MKDDTLDGWLDQQIEYAQNEVGMFRSYGHGGGSVRGERARGFLAALKLVREKMTELGWD
jgi:hypothetical protein